MAKTDKARNDLAARIPVVLSTDVGNEIDDQWAIVWLLTHPAFDVKGILSAHAPTIRPPAGRTALLILRHIVERRLNMAAHPSLVEGASEPLVDAHTPRSSAAAKFLIASSKDFNARRRLNVLTIGPATDLASAILEDPGIVDRIQVVDMGFLDWPDNGLDFNVANDVSAMQATLVSGVPLVVGSTEVCKRGLAVGYEQVREMVGARGPIGQWLWHEYQAWYYRRVKPLRKEDFSKPWVIWDIVVLAHLLGMTKQETYPRPVLRDDLKFSHPATDRTIDWITEINTKRVWADFLEKLDAYEATHALPPEDDTGRADFLS
ncbi:MAG: nucleoside hydrolase [Candidatus Sumerlaeota bacterium]|nr:nucleoside hydrolase [Candidatus Sumerlaeota bacterium]